MVVSFVIEKANSNVILLGFVFDIFKKYVIIFPLLLPSIACSIVMCYKKFSCS